MNEAACVLHSYSQLVQPLLVHYWSAACLTYTCLLLTDNMVSFLSYNKAMSVSCSHLLHRLSSLPKVTLQSFHRS